MYFISRQNTKIYRIVAYWSSSQRWCATIIILITILLLWWKVHCFLQSKIHRISTSNHQTQHHEPPQDNKFGTTQQREPSLIMTEMLSCMYEIGLKIEKFESQKDLSGATAVSLDLTLSGTYQQIAYFFNTCSTWKDIVCDHGQLRSTDGIKLQFSGHITNNVKAPIEERSTMHLSRNPFCYAANRSLANGSVNGWSFAVVENKGDYKIIQKKQKALQLKKAEGFRG
jgi:hypothetical protein